MEDEIPTVIVQRGSTGETVASVAITATGSKWNDSLVIKLDASDKPKKGYPISIWASKQDALRIAVKLIEAVAADAALGKGQELLGITKRQIAHRKP